jgi:hypothetical protein
MLSNRTDNSTPAVTTIWGNSVVPDLKDWSNFEFSRKIEAGKWNEIRKLDENVNFRDFKLELKL